MSTRATYAIDGTPFYIHHDGYPAGAAMHFARMIEALTVPAPGGYCTDTIESRRGGAAFAFVRGNMNAEPTEGHSTHGDTQYRWEIIDDGKRLHVRNQRRGMSSERWSAWSELEPLVDFINRHYPGAIAARLEDWSGREILATLEHALELAELDQKRARDFDESNPNRRIYRERGEAWAGAARPLIELRRAWLAKEADECRAELAKNRTFGGAYYVRELRKLEAELDAIEGYKLRTHARAA